MRKNWLQGFGVAALIVVGGAGVGMAADGAALWEKNCASCHGADGKGDTKAGKMTKVKDFTSGDLKGQMTKDHVQQVVEQGVTDSATGKTRMKGYKDKLAPDEVAALVSHVLGLAGTGK